MFRSTAREVRLSTEPLEFLRGLSSGEYPKLKENGKACEGGYS